MKMREFMAVAKALGDENRVRMLLALQGGEGKARSASRAIARRQRQRT